MLPQLEYVDLEDSAEILLEKERMAKTGSLTWLHWCVLCASVALTLFAWDFSRRQIDENIVRQFDREWRQVVDLVSERMKIYEDALWAGVSVLQAGDEDMADVDWRAFTVKLRIHERHVGINGIGVIYPVRPPEIPEFLRQQRQTRPDFRIHPRHGGPNSGRLPT